MNIIDAKKKFKKLTDTFLEEVFELETIEELMRKQIQSRKNIKVIKQAQKDNEDLSELKEILKQHREKSYKVADFEMDSMKYTVVQIANMVKEYKADVDQEKEDIILSIKSIEGGNRDVINQYKQQIKLIDILIDKRVNV